MKVNLAILINSIQFSLTEYSWLFGLVKKHDGALSLPEPFVSFLSNTNEPRWATYYENPALVSLLPLVPLLGADRYQQLINELSGSTPQQTSEKLAQLQDEILQSPDQFGEDIKLIESIPPDQFLSHLSSLSKDERSALEQKAYYFFTAFVVQLFQFLAVISHGKNMGQLVQLAKGDDDAAYCKAVQVDRTVLFAIPYFRDRLSRAQLSGDQEFLQNLSRSLGGKILGAQVKYPELWLVFSVLHDSGYLESLSNGELLDICEQLNIYSSFDINALAKRKNEFLRKQGRGF